MNKPATHSQYKKLWRSGGSRVLAVGTLLPKDWQLVRVEKVGETASKGKEIVRLKVTKVV